MATSDLNAAVDAASLHAGKEAVILDRLPKAGELIRADGVEFLIAPWIPIDLVDRNVLHFHDLYSLSLWITTMFSTVRVIHLLQPPESSGRMTIQSPFGKRRAAKQPTANASRSMRASPQVDQT